MTEPTSPTPPPPGGGEPPAGSPPPPPSGGPPPGGPPPQAGTAPIPWEDRARLGFGTALIENAKLFITSPKEGFSRTREQGDYGSPILWVVIVAVVAGIIRWIWSLASLGPSMAFLPPEAREQMGWIMGAAAGGGFFSSVILGPIFAIIGLFIGAGIFHLCLMLLKGLEQSTAGFEGSVRAVAYAQIAQLGIIVPFLGGLIVLVWSIFLYVLGLSTLHKTTQGKALGAVLIPVAICCACMLLAMFGIGAAIFSAASSN